MNNETLAKIAALQKMPIGEIKKMWRDLYLGDAPEFNRTYLINRLTYRLQELAWDGEIEPLEKRIAALAKEKLAKNATQDRKRKVNRPLIGTKLLREYKGVEYQVTVLADGFAFDGRKFRSLSRIAEIITGAVWSGPAFFGVQDHRCVLA